MTNPNQLDIDFTPTKVGVKKTTIFSWGILLGGFLGALFPTAIYYYREINKPPTVEIDPALLSLARKIVDRTSNIALTGDVNISSASGETAKIAYLADVQYGTQSYLINDRRGNLDRIIIQNSIQDVLAKMPFDQLVKDPSVVRSKVMASLPKSIVGLHLSVKLLLPKLK